MEIKFRLQLPELMRQFQLPMIAVEIGCAEGFNSRDLLDGGIEKLHMVDNWGTIEGQAGDGSHSQAWHDKNFEQAMQRVKPFAVEDKVVVLRGLSVEMSRQLEDESLGLVYVDCDHSYAGVMNDIAAYYSKLVVGGIMAFHDFLNDAYGVREAVYDFAKVNGLEVHTILELKNEDAGAWFTRKEKDFKYV